MTPRKPSISAFFPAYNEEANVGRLARKTAAVLKKICSRYEVIAVNDGSKDRTAQVIRELSRRDPHIRLVSHAVNQGYGAAVKSGFKAARYDWIFLTDGDGQFDTSEIRSFLPLMDRYDLLIGYRIKRADPLSRKINAWAWGTLVRGLFRLQGARDIDCAFKLIRRGIFRKFRLETTGAMISTELLVKASKNGLRIRELGVSHYPRRAGTQTGAKARVILRAFKELFKYWVKWNIKGYK
jgi:glycosyltransferase involved in cell wall biosynthesis